MVLMLQLNDSWQIGKVALHREYAVNDNKLDGLLWQSLEYTLEVFHVVVLIVQLCGKRQASSVDDTCVVAVIADDVVVAANHHCQYALVDGESGREAEAIILVYKLGYLLLQLYV